MIRVLTAIFVFSAIFAPSLAEECNTDKDCINPSEQRTAGVCKEWGPRLECDNKTVPWTVQFSGSLRSFCQAYVNGCAEASLTLSRGASQVEVSIQGPSTFHEKSCKIRVALGSGWNESGSAPRIADSVEACVHNAPVYFYRTMKEAEKGVMFCCGYPFG